MKKQFLALVLLLILAATAYSAVTIGPMIHANFGGGEVKFSGGIEAAYWDVREGPWSIDLGLRRKRCGSTLNFRPESLSQDFPLDLCLNFPRGIRLGTRGWACNPLSGGPILRELM